MCVMIDDPPSWMAATSERTNVSAEVAHERSCSTGSASPSTRTPCMVRCVMATNECVECACDVYCADANTRACTHRRHLRMLAAHGQSSIVELAAAAAVRDESM